MLCSEDTAEHVRSRHSQEGTSSAKHAGPALEVTSAPATIEEYVAGEVIKYEPKTNGQTAKSRDDDATVLLLELGRR